MVGNLRKLIGDSQFSDVTLYVLTFLYFFKRYPPINVHFSILRVAEGREVPAHKNILAAQCNYFKSMFCDRMKEASANKVRSLHSLLHFALNSRLIRFRSSFQRVILLRSSYVNLLLKRYCLKKDWRWSILKLY